MTHTRILLFCIGWLFLSITEAQPIRYSGTTLSDPYRHDGGLSPVVGTHNIQLMRANRSCSDSVVCQGWTYHHQPMVAYWGGRFWVHYLSNPVSEHVPPSVTWVQSSSDGYHWSSPQILFPEYPVPDRFTKPGDNAISHNTKAVMHQRVGWYVSSQATGRKLLAMGNYGICLHPKDDPNDGNGIGRVVREIQPDGTLGDIFFLYYNHQFNPDNTQYPHFTQSRDKKFRAACQEILDNPLYWMAWVEECDRNDPHLPLTNPYKAFSYYVLPDDSTIVALWKHALTSQSTDGGRTWTQPVERAAGFVNSNAKIWGQRLSDGSYATVYNPAEFRWPLAISTAADGLDYTTLHVVHGEIPPMRYGGNYKSYGPQYVRGILPGNGCPPDSNLWVTYSVNKEDIWVSRVPVPIRTTATRHLADSLINLNDWNLYMPLQAPISTQNEWLVLTDFDKHDYAKAERIIPATRELSISFDWVAAQNDHGRMEMELADSHGNPCTRLQWQADGMLMIKVGARYNTLLKNIEPGRTYHIDITLSLAKRNITVSIDGKRPSRKMLYAPVESVSRIIFRTGERRYFPTPDTPADNHQDLADAGDTIPQASWMIRHLHTAPADNPTVNAPVLLKFADYLHHIEKFNTMEDENIVQAISNAQSADWLQHNIPLFDCPDQQIEEMFYYRWWTLRKHLRQTPVGWAMTEFLVRRSYADQYNLISCALGHHIMESRWLRDTTYVNQIVNTWLRGNDGRHMAKLNNYSSWLTMAVWQRACVTGQTDWLFQLRPDLETDLARWDSLRLTSDSLYWQHDVKDGMEESISGGRRIRNRRPSINSYMFGNFQAMASILRLEAAQTDIDHNRQTDLLRRAAGYERRANQLRTLVELKLWNPDDDFFQTLSEADTLIRVREAIGYLPWYVNLPTDHPRYDTAWQQLTDRKGFDAPFGLTTAEQRHPQFRTHGTGTCEWDGAVWPFATSQTLTALANFANHYADGIQRSGADTLFFRHLKRYTESQYRRGRPYIGEYLDEQDGHWLMGDRERSRYYNHSTYNDLIISGLIGVRPSLDHQLTVQPLLPAQQWSYFCLDGIAYHGHTLTVIWDADGSRYHQGKGLQVWVDGTPVATSATLRRLTIALPPLQP